MTTGSAAAEAAREIRIGLLGCGFMGKCHTNAYKKIPYIYATAGVKPRLALLCDAKPGLADARPRDTAMRPFRPIGKRRPPTRESTCWTIAAPDPLHPEPCIAALKNGKHVICEKPMAVSVEAARRMRDAAAAASGKSMCTFNYRFMPAVRLAKDLIAEGRLGTIYHVRVQYLQMWGHDPSLAAREGLGLGLAALGRFAGDRQPRHRSVPVPGRRDRQRFGLGAGVQQRAGRAQRRLHAGCDLRRRHRRLLDFENGAIGVLESSVVATGRKNYLAWEINGSHGSLRWDMEHPNSLFACLSSPGDDSLLGFYRNLGNREQPSLRGPLVAAGAQSRLGARPNHREVPLPRCGRPRQAVESVQCHVRGRLPRGRDYRRHAQVEPHGTTGCDRVLKGLEIRNQEWAVHFPLCINI